MLGPFIFPYKDRISYSISIYTIIPVVLYDFHLAPAGILKKVSNERSINNCLYISHDTFLNVAVKQYYSSFVAMKGDVVFVPSSKCVPGLCYCPFKRNY